MVFRRNQIYRRGVSEMTVVLVIQTAAGGSHGHRLLVPTGSRLSESDAARLISCVTYPVTVGSAFVGVSRPTDQVTAYNSRRTGKTTAVVSGIDITAAPAATVAAALERMCDCVAHIPAECFGAAAEGSLIIQSPWVDQVLGDIVSLGFVENAQEKDAPRVSLPLAANSGRRSRIALAFQLALATLCGITIGSSLQHSPRMGVEAQHSAGATSPDIADAGFSSVSSADTIQPSVASEALPFEPANTDQRQPNEVATVVAALMHANQQAAVALALSSLPPQSITDLLDVVLESGRRRGLEPVLARAVLQVAPGDWGRRKDLEALREAATVPTDDDLLFSAWRSAPDLESALTAANRYLERGKNSTHKSIVERWRTRCHLEITYVNERNGDHFELQRKDKSGNVATLTSWVIAAERSPRTTYLLPGGLQALRGLRIAFQRPTPTGFGSVFKAPTGHGEQETICDAAAIETEPCKCTFRDGEREVSITLTPMFESWIQFGK